MKSQLSYDKFELTMAHKLNVLDPDDKLMKKFQRTLHAHLLHVDDKLSKEIFDLESSIKQAEKELESEAVCFYQMQQDVEHQHETLQHYIETLTKVSSLREKRNQNIESIKQLLKQYYTKLKEEKDKKENLSKELKNLLAFYGYLSKWEKDLNDHLIISKQMSLQDANRNKALINKKQQRDFVLFRLKEEIWKIEFEIGFLNEQLQLKNKEKEDANKTLIDANTDLETLHMEHKGLHSTWKSVVASICKRNVVYDQLYVEQQEAHKLYDGLLLEIQKIRKETEKEMEINEHLTSLSFRIENNIKITSRIINAYHEKIANCELALLHAAKINEQTEHDYNNVFNKYQNYLYEEEQVTRKLENIIERKNSLEDAIFKNIEEKVICNKTAQYINELLISTKDSVLEYEISVARVENTYGNNLLEFEKLTNLIENQKTELQELSQKNFDKEKQIDDLQKEIRKYEVKIEKAQTKLLGINKLIDEMLQNVGGEDLSPQDLKIIGLEKNIQTLQQNIKKTQQFWMRQQGFVVLLTQQRESQLQELNLLGKEIMIMGQKNFKLKYELEMLAKEEAHTNKIIISLDQKLSRMNSNLVIQKDLKKELQDKNCVTKSECVLSFQELELELIKLQTELKDLCTEKVILKEELKSAQQESLSWEKKVQLMQSTIKDMKEEHSAGGIASMKSEIHRMEMRLSYLKKIQEKLIHDMDLCIERRDIILDKVFGKLKRNPKVKHNEKVVMHKRLSDQKIKIKQLLKITKETDNIIQKLKNQISGAQSKIFRCEHFLQGIRKQIDDLEDKIEELEMLKYYNLHNLVLKQRKVKQLYDIKGGIYKMVYKNENIIKENLEREQGCQEYLKYALEKIDQNFPMFRNSIKRILLTLQIF